MKILEQSPDYRIIERFLWLPTDTAMGIETRWFTRQKILQRISERTSRGFYRGHSDWTDWDWVD